MERYFQKACEKGGKGEVKDGFSKGIGNPQEHEKI